MPMSAVYATVNGVLVEESRGGSVSCYVPDTLGSVVATTDASGSVTSRTEYWPYGEVRTQTGTNPSPWGFCGTWGYLRDAASRLYVRARVYRPREGRWNTLDPLWPEGEAYAYVRNRPTNLTDELGLDPRCSCNPPRSHGVKRGSKKERCYQRACNLFCSRLNSHNSTISDLCGNPLECRQTNDEFRPCNSLSPYHRVCANIILEPDGDLYNGACANKSHYPCPKPQISIGPVPIPGDIGGEWCCVECKMRVCCDLMDRTDPIYRLKFDLRRCDRKFP